MGMCMMYLEKFLMQVEIDLVDCLIKLCWKLLVSKEDIIVFLSIFIDELVFLYKSELSPFSNLVNDYLSRESYWRVGERIENSL